MLQHMTAGHLAMTRICRSSSRFIRAPAVSLKHIPLRLTQTVLLSGTDVFCLLNGELVLEMAPLKQEAYVQ
jgi:hypothetical protein